MKKIMSIMCCLLITGCFSSVGGPKETVDTINEQKLAAAKISVQSALALTNQKYLLEPNKFKKQDNYYCISIEYLNVSNEFISGYTCINDSSHIKAVNIIYGNYICNGDSNNLECLKND